jgi:hypothetical protein
MVKVVFILLMNTDKHVDKKIMVMVYRNIVVILKMVKYKVMVLYTITVDKKYVDISNKVN